MKDKIKKTLSVHYVYCLYDTSFLSQTNYSKTVHIGPQLFKGWIVLSTGYKSLSSGQHIGFPNNQPIDDDLADR